MEKKLKIVELIPYLSIGGAEVFTDALTKSFPVDKCDVTLVSMRDYVHDRFKDSINKDYKFISLGKKPGFNFGFGKRLYNAIKEIDPDIIHVHLNCVNYAAKYLSKLRAKIFYTVHSIPKQDNKFIFRLMSKPYFKKGRIIPIGISKEISLLIEEEYGIKNVLTINNGVMLKNTNPSEERIYDFINVGRFSEVKNQMSLIKAFNEVVKVNKDLKMIIVGHGPLEEEIKKLVKSLKLESNVTIISNGESPYKYLVKSKVFVLPSHYEGNPLSLIEAFDCGCAAIASNVGGIPDVLKDNINGYLLENDNVDLVNKMIKMMQDKEAIIRFSKQNLIDCKKYDIKNTANEYYRVFINETR